MVPADPALDGMKDSLMLGSKAQMSFPPTPAWVHAGFVSSRKTHLVLVIAILTYVALLPVAKEYWKYEFPTLHCTGYHSMLQRPSPDCARSREPDRHSGHSSVAMAYCTVGEMGLAPAPEQHHTHSKISQMLFTRRQHKLFDCMCMH